MTDQPIQTDPTKGTRVRKGVWGQATMSAPREIALIIDDENVTKIIPNKPTPGEWEPFDVWVTD